LWARHLFSQAQHEARSQLSVERLKRQLATETTGLLRPEDRNFLRVPGQRRNVFGLPERELRQLRAGEQYFDSHFFCPDGGRYAWSDDGKCVTCTVHGSASEPRQPAAPSPASDLGRLLGDLSDLKLTLTFLEDGLHAVVTVSRK
jgi:hypothetical protein